MPFPQPSVYLPPNSLAARCRINYDKYRKMCYSCRHLDYMGKMSQPQPRVFPAMNKLTPQIQNKLLCLGENMNSNTTIFYKNSHHSTFSRPNPNAIPTWYCAKHSALIFSGSPPSDLLSYQPNMLCWDGLVFRT